MVINWVVIGRRLVFCLIGIGVSNVCSSISWKRYKVVLLREVLDWEGSHYLLSSEQSKG